MTLLPTRRRPELLTQFLKSALEAETSTPGMVIVDKKDWKENEDVYEDIRQHLPKDWDYWVVGVESMSDKIRWVWPHLKESKWVNVLNDDHVIVTKNWDTKLLKYLNGHNFVTCNDRWMAPQKATGATIWSMPLLEAVGFPIYPTGLQHLFIDDVWEKIGKSTGCWHIEMSVIILHKHAIKGESDKDETYFKIYNKKAWDYDTEHFEHFMKDEFRDVVKKVIALESKDWKDWKI